MRRARKSLLGNHRKIFDFFNDFGQIYGGFMERIGLKAPQYHSGPFWSYNFSICLWERPKLLMAMISGCWDVSPSPETNYDYLWRPQDTLQNPRQSQILFEKYDFVNFGISEIQQV